MGLFDKLKKSVELGAKALGDLAENGAKALNKATDNDGSYAKYEMEIKISAADMEKFSNADWSNEKAFCIPSAS